MYIYYVLRKVFYSDPNYSYRYTARRFDNETRLYYYRARYYDVNWGRFLQPDPAGYGDGLNLYAYVGNSPLSFVDPSGLIRDTASSHLSLLQEHGREVLDQTEGTNFNRIFGPVVEYRIDELEGYKSDVDSGNVLGLVLSLATGSKSSKVKKATKSLGNRTSSLRMPCPPTRVRI